MPYSEGTHGDFIRTYFGAFCTCYKKGLSAVGPHSELLMPGYKQVNHTVAGLICSVTPTIY